MRINEANHCQPVLKGWIGSVRYLNNNGDYKMSSRQIATNLLMAITVSGTLIGTALGDGKHPWDDDDRGGRGRDAKELRARPFVFVGTADQCGGTAGADIVTAAWLGGMGL